MQSKNLIYRMKKKIESNGGHDSIAFKELGENGDEIATLTYNELHYRALHYAEKIKLKTKKNDRVILLYPAQLDFIVAFIACLYAKVIAVPVNPPSRNQKIHRLISIIEDADPALILTTPKIKLSAQNSGIVDKYSKLEWLCLSEIDPPGLISVRSNITLDVDIDSSDVAFLQYTSGSSGNPKGVVIRHKNLVCNLDMIRRAYGVEEKTIMVSWLPMFHDLGLIGMVLQTIYSCCECIVIPPSVFLRTPDIWLRTISKYKATISGAPNFGYEHCNRRIKKEKLESIDLSSWKIAYCGAEPIRKDVIETFAINFEEFGLNPKALFPSYGMAEATLCVTAGLILKGIIFDKPEIDKTELSEHFEFIASCGSPKDDTEIQIVDPKSKHRCKDRQVGEIWLRGSSIATEYWNKPGKTKKSFQARIKGDKNKFYYRTGDLGYLKDNELYVTGRLSDLIIIRGVNYYPQDIEVLAANSSEWLVKGGGVAFSVEVEGQEKLVLLQELDRTVVRKKSSYYEKLRNDIQKDLYENLGIRADTIIFLKPGKVFRTSSGKVQRKKSRKVYLENNLEGIVDRGPIDVGTSVNSEKSTSIELEYIRKILKEQVAEILKCNIDAIDIFQPFHNYGMDSVAAAEIAHAIEEKFQISLPTTAVFDYPDISSISKHICECVKNNSESVVGDMPPRTSGASRRRRALTETQSPAGASAQAIQAHYDTGNTFYRLWLDPTLTYSCALWDDAHSLEEAQVHKLEHHIREAGASGAARVLDIGCGWGSLLERLTVDHGVGHAVGLTLSEAQLKHIESRRLEHAELRLESWLDHEPEAPYDAIVSIGAFEHFVRPEMSSEERIRIYRHFFDRCRSMLRPGGRMSLQTMAYGEIGRFRSGSLAAIFPESDLPRLAELAEAMERKFEIVRMRNDPSHYARTVRIWLDAFRRRRNEIVDLVGEQRTSEYERFLSGGIMGYSIGVFNLFRMTLGRVDLGD